MNLDEALAVRLHYDELPRGLTAAEQVRYDHARDIVAGYAEATAEPAPDALESAVLDGVLTDAQWRMVGYVTIAFLIGALVGLGMASRAAAFDRGQYDDVPESVRQWFKAQRNPETGIPCCDVADGYNTEAQIRGNHWFVPVPNHPEMEWVEVPDGAIIHNQGNPNGNHVVWWADFNAAVPKTIRCFVPGGGV